MKITVIGSGYVGLVTGACLADIGHQVFCLDLDRQKIEGLKQGVIPIYEPGLDDIVIRNVKAGRLIFSTNIEDSVAHGDVQYIAVGTPPKKDGSANLDYVLGAAASIGQYMQGYKIIIDKSTVPVGTADRVSATIRAALSKRAVDLDFAVVSNPEFLKEGDAIKDFMHPDRIVIGVASDEAGHRAKTVLQKIYEPLNRHHDRTYFMDVKSAELTKYAANAMLATRISFMNELSGLAEAVGADIESVRKGIGSDSRIGFSFLYAGTGYGGSCFPKDVTALIHTAHDSQINLSLLQAVDQANRQQKYVLVRKVLKRLGHDLNGKTFGVWGLSFKPNTDDMRDAPSRVIIRELLLKGALVQVYDPVAQEEAKKALRADLTEAQLASIKFCHSKEEALQGSDALMIVTEWKEFKVFDFNNAQPSHRPFIIFDGRNLYAPEDMAALNIEYHSIGRATVKPGSHS